MSDEQYLWQVPGSKTVITTEYEYDEEGYVVKKVKTIETIRQQTGTDLFSSWINGRATQNPENVVPLWDWKYDR